jgi:hypothetical protein
MSLTDDNTGRDIDVNQDAEILNNLSFVDIQIIF